jgi:hypothetical protein
MGTYALLLANCDNETGIQHYGRWIRTLWLGISSLSFCPACCRVSLAQLHLRHHCYADCLAEVQEVLLQRSDVESFLLSSLHIVAREKQREDMGLAQHHKGDPSIAGGAGGGVGGEGTDRGGGPKGGKQDGLLDSDTIAGVGELAAGGAGGPCSSCLKYLFGNGVRLRTRH